MSEYITALLYTHYLPEKTKMNSKYVTKKRKSDSITQALAFYTLQIWGVESFLILKGVAFHFS